MDRIITYSIGILSAFISLWSSGKAVHIGDFTYFIENSYRIYLGHLPYRDFVLVLTPGTYYISALIMKLFGPSYNFQIAYIMCISFLTVIITYKILSLLGVNKVLNYILLLPLIFSGHAISAFPSYDMNAIFFALGGVYLVLRLHQNKYHNSNLFHFITGIALVLPTLFKQNIGVVYFILMLCLIAFDIIHVKKHYAIMQLISLFSGVILVIIAFFGYLYVTSSLHAFIFQAVLFPIKARNPENIFFHIFYDAIRARTIFFSIPFIIIALLMWTKKATSKILLLLVFYASFISPFVFAAYLYMKYRHIVDISFIPGYMYMFSTSIWYVVMVITIFMYAREKNVTFMGMFAAALVLFSLSPFSLHRIESATFCFYPILAILLALLYRKCKKCLPHIYLISLGAAFYLCLSLLRVSPPECCSNALFEYINNTIPKHDSVIELPGDIPLHYATKRIPPLPYFQYFSQTLPYSPKYYMNQIEEKKVKWVIVDTESLKNKNIMDVSFIIKGLKNSYSLKKHVYEYNIYRRIQD